MKVSLNKLFLNEGKSICFQLSNNHTSERILFEELSDFLLIRADSNRIVVNSHLI